MPNRIIREGFLDSEAVNRLSDRAERLFVRLLIAADDAGRCDARVEWLGARLFPTLRLRSSDIQARLAECVNAGLLTGYVVFGRPFVQIMKWQRQGSSKRSTFPDVNGNLEIEYVSIMTSDGNKEFVKESIPIPRGGQDGVYTGSLPGFSFSPRTPLSVLEDGKGTRTCTDEEWLESLSKDPTYEGIDVRREHGKMVNWCQANGKAATRRRFINWINRVEKPMKLNGTHQSNGIPNPRNAGVGGNSAERSARIAAKVARQNGKADGLAIEVDSTQRPLP